MNPRGDLDRDRIDQLLGAVREQLVSDGVAASIYVVGGAAIALRGVIEARRTADVDALIVPEREVVAAAERVADEHGGVDDLRLHCAAIQRVLEARPARPTRSTAPTPPAHRAQHLTRRRDVENGRGRS